MSASVELDAYINLIDDYAKTQQFTVVRKEHEHIDDLSSTTGLTFNSSATLFPTTRDQVQYIIEQANQHKVAIHPISKGKNWGYTDATPSCNNSVMLDLSAMNKIVEINEESKYAVIEPGVTQQQLSNALKSTNLFMDCTGSSATSSIVGNILERGFGHTAFGDRFAHSSSYEMILGNGKLYGTGHFTFNEINEYTAKSCHNARTTGPSLEGLFSQSNFGVVTRLCIWLMEKPEKILPFIVIFKNHENFLKAISPISKLKMLGVMPSTIHIGNELRILSSSVSWKNYVGLVPQCDIDSQLSEINIGSWVMSGALYGSKSMVRVFETELKKALGANCKAEIKFLEPKLIKTVGCVLSYTPKTMFVSQKSQVETAQGIIDMHSGKPTNLFLKGCYHRHHRGYPEEFNEDTDVAKDGCGLIWLAPTVPSDPVIIDKLLMMLKEIFKSYGLHLYATLSFINSRSMAVICNPIFDSSNKEQTDVAIKCTSDALEQCIRDGFPPYRVANVHWTMYRSHLNSEHQLLVDTIKKQLDPNNVISPGRYGIGE